MTRRLVFLAPVALFAVLVVAFGLGLRHDPKLVPSAMIDRPAPDFDLPGLDGAGLKRGDLEGHVDLVNFFASWCVPCRDEHLELMALSTRPGIRLYGIVYKDTPQKAQQFLAELGDPYRRIGVDRDGATAINFGVYGVPETYVVDAGGHIRYRHVGPLAEADIEDKIVPMLGRLAAAARPQPASPN
jgi:cytochrome c biogenesis protein CcmG, thiol:disulfide interchange protein DsbE